MWQTWPDHWTDRLLFCAQGNSAGRACCSRGPVKHWPVSSTDWPVHGIPVACDVTVPRDNSFTLHVVVTRHVATASDASDALGGGCQATIIRGDKTYVWTVLPPVTMNFVFIALRSEANMYFVGRLVDNTSHGCGCDKLKFTWTFMVKFVNAVISRCDFWLLFPSKESGHLSRTVSANRWLWNETICGTTEALSDSALLTQAVPWFAGYKAIHLLHYSTAMLYVWCEQSLDLCSRLIGW